MPRNTPLIVTWRLPSLQVHFEVIYITVSMFFRLRFLRKRKEGIPLLVEYFIDRFARKAGKSIRGINKKTLDPLLSYPWPGMRITKRSSSVLSLSVKQRISQWTKVGFRDSL